MPIYNNYGRPYTYILITTSDKRLTDNVDILMQQKSEFDIHVFIPYKTKQQPILLEHISINGVIITKVIFDGDRHYITADLDNYTL